MTMEIHFKNAGLTVSIAAEETEFHPVAGGMFLLSYRPSEEPPSLVFRSGDWKLEGDNAQGNLLNPGERGFDTGRLLLGRGERAARSEVVEGFIEVSKMVGGSALSSFLGQKLAQGSGRIWLAAEGVVVWVSAGRAMPGPATNSTVPALFRKAADGRLWEWRLLNQWPRKGSPQQKTTLRERYASVLDFFASDLQFLAPAERGGFRLSGEEEALGEPAESTGAPTFTPFDREPPGDKPWWRTGLITTRVRLSSPPRRAAEGKPERGV